MLYSPTDTAPQFLQKLTPFTPLPPWVRNFTMVGYLPSDSPFPPPPTQHYHQRVPFPQQKEILTRLNFLAFKQAWITINPARHAFLWLQECLRQVRERFVEGLALSVLDLSLACPQEEMLIMLKGS